MMPTYSKNNNQTFDRKTPSNYQALFNQISSNQYVHPSMLPTLVFKNTGDFKFSFHGENGTLLCSE
jgi:hypothetical protein